MNIVDSSAWLEYIAKTPARLNFKKIIENTDELIVPVIVIYEVYKRILSEHGEDAAANIISYMSQGHVVPLDLNMSLFAAKLSREHKLPMADSIILATAEIYDATIWTQDADFKKFKRAKYFKKNFSGKSRPGTE